MSRAENGLLTGGACSSAVLQNDAAPCSRRRDNPLRFIVIPPPVKFRAFAFGSFEAMLQLGALMFGLP